MMRAVMAAAVVACQQRYSSSFSPPSILHPTMQISRRRVCSISSRHTFIGVLYASDDDALINNSMLPGDSDSNDHTTHDRYSRYTHQIAIPLADATELNSALRDIQTSLVRDCPRLIRACVMPALLRLPLLYVDGRSLQNNGMNIGTGSRGSVDDILEQVVHRAIRNVVYRDDDVDIDNDNKSSKTSNEATSISSDAVMIDMVKPILLPFRGLELQGQDNSVLYAVGNNINEKRDQKLTKKIIRYNDDNDDDDDGTYIVDDWSIGAPSKTNNNPSGWEVLEKLVHTIQYELENKYGLQTCWPLDEPQGEEIEYDIPVEPSKECKNQQWRPRVPFVRLPLNFYEDLHADMKKKGEDKNFPKVDDEGDDDSPIQIDMGFDGISPLFWYETWCDADILPPPGVRMQSIAIYRRMVSDGGEAESSFYIPTSSSGDKSSSQPWNNIITDALNMQLPIGDAKQMARERREKAMANERLSVVEQREEREWEEGKARWMEEMSNRMSEDIESSIINKESLNEFDVSMEFGNVSVEGDAAYSTHWSERGVEKSSSAVPEESLPYDEDRPAIDSRMIPQSQRLESKSQRKDLPSIDENPIFQRFRNKQSQITTNGQNTALTLDGTPPTTDVPLPPYPSDDHFVGAWRVVSSPLGGEESSFEATTANSKTSDNFILRVDGQVMGGPILDAKYQHKAAGGNWKMFQATRRKSSVDAYDDEIVDDLLQTQTRLRIRLLVPPEKERLLVMEGEVTRLVMPGSADISSSYVESSRLILPAGGIVDGMIQSIEDMQLSQSDEVVKKSSGEVLLYCAGEAWMEDVNGGANRKKLGSFGLQKLKTVKRDQLIYTVDISRQIDRGNEIDSEEANSI